MVSEPGTGADLVHAQAFAKVYAAQCGRLYAYLRYQVGDAALAEDMTAEVFTRAWARRGDPRAPETMVAWLFATARNLVADHYRRQRKERLTLRLDAVPAPWHPLTGSPEDGVLRAERLALVRRCLDDLGVREREILELRFVARLRNREIAPILGLSEGNVAKILHRTLRALRARLDQEEGGDGRESVSAHLAQLPR